MSERERTAGLIGAGRMGLAIVGHLRRAGYEVCVYDVSDAAGRAAVDLGASLVETPGEVAKHASVVFIAVGFDAETALVCRDAAGLFERAPKDTLIVVSSTVKPALVRALDAEARARGLALLDVPIARGRHAAQQGTLLALAGGPEGVLDRARPMLSTFCSDILRVGEVGQGQVAKSVNNLLLWAAATALSEAAQLAEAEDMDLPTLREALLMSSGKSWPLENWDSVFFTWAKEDMISVLDMADQHNLSLPLLGQIREQVKWAKANKEAGKARWTAPD
jgi:3-hydroxyisobutyrate dehydrogenase-like beta-hydroxyacid dehydrogenase